MTARGVAAVRATRDDQHTINLAGVTSTVVGRQPSDERPEEPRTARIANKAAPVAMGTRTPSAATTVVRAAPTSRRPPGPRLALPPLVAALAAVLLGLGPNFTRPILAADTAAPATPTPRTTATAAPAAPVGPSCGPGAAPAGHNPPTRIEVATHHTYLPAGWLRWCTGMRESRVGPVKAAWIVMQLDRATVVASDLCQLHDCQITLTMSVPTRGPDLAVYRARIDRTGPAQATVTTTAVIVGGRHDFAEAHSASSTVFISPRGYTESV